MSIWANLQKFDVVWIEEEGRERLILFRLLEDGTAEPLKNLKEISIAGSGEAGQSVCRGTFGVLFCLTEDGTAEPLKNLEEISFAGSGLVDIKWSYDASAFLVLSTVLFDENNNNYYGTTVLQHARLKEGECTRVPLDKDGPEVECTHMPLDKDGPIHVVKWSPTSLEFVVIFGSMPAKALLYNHVSRPVFSYGSGSWNTVEWAPHGRFLCLAGFGSLAGQWAPHRRFLCLAGFGSLAGQWVSHGRFLCLAGFGSLAGQMEFWDKALGKKLGSGSARCAIYRQFSPCSRFFLTAVTYPGLRMDNEITLFKYDGSTLFREQ
ncbi:eukaryotic translation initiation factor eIF2A-domain-containing protein, partial [Baffinella frigidus]